MSIETTQREATKAWACDFAERYEALRDVAVQRPMFESRRGLVVLLRNGLASSMELWAALPALPERVQTRFHQPWRSPDEATAEMVRVLAGMTLSHIYEVQT